MPEGVNAETVAASTEAPASTTSAPASTSTGTENVSTNTAVAIPQSNGPTTPQVAKPTSFVDALKKAETAASSTATNDPTQVAKPPVPGPKAQVGPDGKPVVQPQDDPTKDAAWMGIPEGRRNTILQNARKDERKLVEQEVAKEFGWAKDLDGEKVTAGLGLVSDMYSDPVKFVTRLIGEIRAMPQLAPALAQALGDLGSGQPAPSNGAPAPKQGWQVPQPKLKAEDGTAAYSSDQVIEIVEQKVAEALGQHVKPLSDRFATMDEREQVVQLVHESRTEAADVMAEMRTMPHWTKEAEPKIAAILQNLPPQLKAKAGAIGSLQIAYNKYLRDHVFPGIETAAEARVRERDRVKANASTGQVALSGQTQQGVVKKPKTPAQLAAHMAAMAKQG